MAHEEIKCKHPPLTLLGWNEKHNPKPKAAAPKTDAPKAVAPKVEEPKKVHHRQIRLASMVTMASIGEAET